MSLISENENAIDILIVDDSPMQTAVIKDMLKDIYDYNIKSASTGNMLLEMMEEFNPKIILLDLILPDIDGFTLCRKIKHKYNISVILISSLDDSAAVVKGFNAGADDFVAKPFVKEVLIARIKNQLRIRSLQDELIKKNKELEDSYESISRLSIIDVLTKAYNRLYFNDVLIKKFDEFKRYGVKFTCALIDINNFKALNSRVGHIAGDKVLVDLVKYIKECLRESDFLARFAGHKFVILYSSTSLENAEKASEKLINHISEKEFDNGENVTIRVGMCEVNENILNPFDVVYFADEALIKTKN